MLNILLILLPVFILSVNFILIKQSFLLNFNGDKHQKFVTKKEIPLSGHIFHAFSLPFNYKSHSVIRKFSCREIIYTANLLPYIKENTYLLKCIHI